MSDITDFATMKLLESEHLQARSVSSLEMFPKLFPKMTRNLGFRVLAPEMARVDAVIAVLHVSKQEFMLEVLRDALDRTCEVIEKRGWLPAYEQAYKESLEAMGYRQVNREDGSFGIESIEDETQSAQVVELGVAS